MLEVAREQAPHATLRARRCALAAVRGRRASTASSRVYFYCHLEERGARALPRRGAAGRARARRRRVRARERRRARGALGGARAERRLRRWQVYKRSSRRTMLAAELGGGERRLPRSLVRRRPRLTRRRSSLPLARVAAARQPRLPRVRRSRLSARVAAGRTSRTRPARLHVRPGAGHRRGTRSGGPGAAAPARPCAAGSSWTRTSSTRTFYCASVTRCYPGRRRPGAATARRRRASRSSARSGANWELELLEPAADRARRRPRHPPPARPAERRPSASAAASSSTARRSSRSPTRPAPAAGSTRRRIATLTRERGRRSSAEELAASASDDGSPLDFGVTEQRPPLSRHVCPSARLPAPLQALAGRLDRCSQSARRPPRSRSSGSRQHVIDDAITPHDPASCGLSSGAIVGLGVVSRAS